MLAAALFKLERLWTVSTTASGFFESIWIQTILVEAELAGGLALWIGSWPKIVRWAAMVLFATFLGAALSQAVAGARSCACFGNLQVHPWFAVVVDAGSLSILYYWKAGRGHQRVSVTVMGRCAAIAAFGLVLLIPVALFAFGPSAANRRLEVFPATIDLGIVQQGGRRPFALHLRNPQNTLVTIEDVESSCPCVEASGVPWVFEAGAEKTVELVLDLAREPDFVGRLSINIRGVDAVQSTALAARVDVIVAAPRVCAKGWQ